MFTNQTSTVFYTRLKEEREVAEEADVAATGWWTRGHIVFFNSNLVISAQGLKVKIKYFIVETGLRTPKYPVPRFSNLSHDSSSEHTHTTN